MAHENMNLKKYVVFEMVKILKEYTDRKHPMKQKMIELDMKALNMNELSFNELEQVSGGMSLFEFLIRQSRQNEDD